MATWTSAQLANQVLKELGIVGIGQTASAADTAKVTDVWGSIYARLRRQRLASWGSEAISEEAQLPVAKYVAGLVASSFNFRGNDLLAHQATGQEGLRELQEVEAGDKHPSPPKFYDY